MQSTNQATRQTTNQPDVQTAALTCDQRNAITEARQIEELKTNPPDATCLYVRLPKDGECAKVITWPGTAVGNAWLGERKTIGFQGYSHTYRRAITTRIFGTLYHGWYYESSGDYCRLKKAKRQDGKYAATMHV